MTDGLHGSYRSDVWDERGKLDVSLFQSALDSTPICIELPSEWLNIISGLLDVFRSTRYLEGTDNQIVEFQTQVDEIQQKIALMESCLSGMVNCNDIDQCLIDSVVIQNIITDIENTYNSVVNNYNQTNTIINNLDSDDILNYVEALIWEKLATYPANNASVVSIPILSGYLAFRIRVFGGTDGANKVNILARVNADGVNSNYSSAINFEIVNTSPRIGNLHANGVSQSLPSGYIECYNYEDVSSHVLSAFTYAHGDTGGLNRTQVGSVVHFPTSPITQIDIVGYSFPTNGDLYFDVEYLSEKKVSLAKSYAPPPPPPPPIVSGKVEDLITFNPADSGVFTTNNGTVLDALGNPDYHLYLYQASLQSVPVSLDCTVTLPYVRKITRVEFDYMVWNNDTPEDVPVNIRVQAISSGDIVLQSVDFNDPAVPDNIWTTGGVDIDQTNVDKIELIYFGYGSPDSEEYELRLDNIRVITDI